MSMMIASSVIPPPIISQLSSSDRRISQRATQVSRSEAIAGVRAANAVIHGLHSASSHIELNASPHGLEHSAWLAEQPP